MMARPSCVERSRHTERFPRLSWEKYELAVFPRWGSPVSGSTLVTDAAQSPRRAAAEGPASATPNSRTVTP